jgi:hypothetical protein
LKKGSGNFSDQKITSSISSITQSKGREQEAPEQEDEAPYEYALTSVRSQIGVKTDSRDEMTFWKIEERWWRFYGW